MQKLIGIYVHVPFCAKKCPYCDFYSVKYDARVVEQYVKAVCNDIIAQSRTLSACEVDSVYFGGGTPSLLKPSEIACIIGAIGKSLTVTKDVEVTMEANPNTISLEKLQGYRTAGVNRVSFGVQSLNEVELQSLGRTHGIKHCIEAVNNTQKAGFSNISIDLMLGTPYQTKESVRVTLEKAVTLPITHISAYMLKIEEDTDYYNNPITEFCVDEDDIADIYLDTVDFLNKNNFPQYEISNFAKIGYESRHNLKYWECKEYIGLGPSAHSYIGSVRYGYTQDVEAYIQASLTHKISSIQNITDSRAGEFDEEIMLGLRLNRGIPKVNFEQIEGFSATGFQETLNFLEKLEYIKLENNIIKLTPKGFLISNQVINKLLKTLG